MSSEPDAFARMGSALADLARIADRLRAPDGCPWDREQTHASLRPYVLEEAHETLEAIDGGDPALLRDELGDLLFQVVFHAQLAREEGAFDLADVATRISEKLVRRHPHVFQGTPIEGAADRATGEDVIRQWERIKAEERRDATAHLRQANERFAARIRGIEERARAAGRALSSYDPDELWAMWESTR